jgi:uncharacterized protein (DUF1800 family)
MPTLTPISGSLGAIRAKHLLRRLTYGPTKEQVETFAGLDVNTALNQLFNNWTLPEPPIALLDAWERNPPAGGKWVDQKPQEESVGKEKGFKFMEYFRKWWLGRMYFDNSALEKATFFLHTVITTKDEVGGGPRAIFWQNQFFRQYLINDFSDINPKFNRYKVFIKKMCIDNSMLAFLDGRLNVKGRPNENFGREMLELFTIGKGESKAPRDYTNYTEDDIVAAAKVLTGWDTNDKFYDPTTYDVDTLMPVGKVKGYTNSQSTLIGTQHDNDPKTFTAKFGGTTVQPSPTLLSGLDATYASMDDEIVQMIDMVYAASPRGDGIPEAARYFCRRLYRYYVHWNVTDEIENTVIAELADTFAKSGFRVRTVFEKLFTSDFFYQFQPTLDDDKYGSIIKSPMEVMLGIMRYFEIKIDPLNTPAFYSQFGTIDGVLGTMGLDFMNPYDVAGYEPYHQSPYFNRNWITTNTLANRYAFVRDLLESGSKPLGFFVDSVAWARSAKSGITNAIATTKTVAPNGKTYMLDLVRHVAGELLAFTRPEVDMVLTLERLAYFGEVHLGGLDADNWIFNWNNNTPEVKPRLDLLMNAILQSPEFQLF